MEGRPARAARTSGIQMDAILPTGSSSTILMNLPFSVRKHRSSEGEVLGPVTPLRFHYRLKMHGSG